MENLFFLESQKADLFVCLNLASSGNPVIKYRPTFLRTEKYSSSDFIIFLSILHKFYTFFSRDLSIFWQVSNTQKPLWASGGKLRLIEATRLLHLPVAQKARDPKFSSDGN